ncbi:MAG: hypothetical protein PHZ23_14620 [Acidiphilium sp.]|nr:hypothetical protein [Acidiphilium sp.]
MSPGKQRERAIKSAAIAKAKARDRACILMSEILGYVDDSVIDDLMSRCTRTSERKKAIYLMAGVKPGDLVREDRRRATQKRAALGIEIRDEETMDKIEAQRIIEDVLLPKALIRVEQLLDDPQGSHGAQMTIAKEIFDRTLGKVTQKIDVGDSKTIDGTIERAKDAAALQREIVLMLNREPDKAKWPPDLRAAYERMVNPKSLTIEGG